MSAYDNLRSNAKKCEDQLVVLDRFFQTQQDKVSFLRLKEYENEFNKLNTPEMEGAFTHLDSINHKLKFLKKVKSEIESTIMHLGQISSINIDSILEDQKDEQEWCRELIVVRLELKQFNDLAAKRKSELLGELNGSPAAIRGL